MLGSSLANIVGLLSNGFLRLVLIANLIAWPLTWYAMNHWLSDFAYRIDLYNNFWIFIVASLGAVFIALITISFKTLNTALANPANSLRNEKEITSKKGTRPILHVELY